MPGDESYPILLRMFTFCLNFKVYRRLSAVSLTMAVISAPDSGYGSLEELEPEDDVIRDIFKPDIIEQEKTYIVFSCSPPSNDNRTLGQETEDIDQEEQESFKLYLKRVKECLAGRSKDDSMERLDPIIISVYKFLTKSYFLQIVCLA